MVSTLSTRAVNTNTLKYISLLTLTLQNAILGLSMRYARTRPGDIFLSSTGEALLRQRKQMRKQIQAHTYTHTHTWIHLVVMGPQKGSVN